ncbi:MAG: hypothetical protein H0X17_20740 [Deltaproteobacteria bacterium]|nr:hypothetical protein [Deltaproteobacteria bacterium]
MGKPAITKQEAAAARAQLDATVQAILVTTGDVHAKYQPVNIVFAVGSAPTAQAAFQAARAQLQGAAVVLGGHGVVYCRFGYESASSTNLGCSSTTFIVSGYGTVVKFV